MKERLDQILLDLNLVENRNKARGFIVDGKVLVDGEKIIKPGTMYIREKIKITLLHDEKEYVSRAGKKLDKALKVWKIDLTDKTCLDIGSSTGGFTDCCLTFGAKFVYAVDVGTNQLDWKLRSNPKVKAMEKTNFRNVTKDFFKLPIEFFCCDVSFISVEKILLPLQSIVENEVEGVILIKPQFESDREDVKNGKINTKAGHIKSISRVINYCNENGFSVLDIDFSPILGNKKKNIEYLCWIRRTNNLQNKFLLAHVQQKVDSCWDYFENIDESE